MEFIVVNLKEFSPTVELATANMLIEIENARRANIKGIKFIHGYGSHNAGGSIRQELKLLLPRLKRNRVIKDFINGADWNIGNQKTFEFLETCPSSALDEDLNNFNVGITIIIV